MASIARHDRDGLRRDQGGGASRLLAIPVMLILALAAVTLLYIIYVLWPRWPEPPVSPDAPSLPITVGGVTFNVPPAAIRVALQRRVGTQERIDLAFLWPSLTPPDLTAKPGDTAPADSRDQHLCPRRTGTEAPAGGGTQGERRDRCHDRRWRQ